MPRDNRSNTDRLNEIFGNVSGIASDIRANRLANLQEEKLRNELAAEKSQQTPVAKIFGSNAELTPEAEAQTIAANKAKWEALKTREMGVATQEQQTEENSMQSPEAFISPREKFRQKFGVVPETPLSQYKTVQSAEGIRAKTENPTPDVFVNPSDPTQISFQKVNGWLPVKPRDALTQVGNANKSEVQFGEKQDQQTQKRLEGLSNALDPSKQRQGAFGVSKQIFDRAERLQSLSNAFSGGNLDSRQVEELAIGLNAMLSGSNVGAQQQVKSLVPQSAIGDALKLKEWIMNDPQGLNQQEFVKRMLGTIEREKNTSEDQMNRTRFQRIAAYADLEQKNPVAFNDVLNSQGVDIGKYKAWKTGGHKFMSAVQNPEQNVGKSDPLGIR